MQELARIQRVQPQWHKGIEHDSTHTLVPYRQKKRLLFYFLNFFLLFFMFILHCSRSYPFLTTVGAT
jgi:hypothetical protein